MGWLWIGKEKAPRISPGGFAFLMIQAKCLTRLGSCCLLLVVQMSHTEHHRCGVLLSNHQIKACYNIIDRQEKIEILTCAAKHEASYRYANHLAVLVNERAT